MASKGRTSGALAGLLLALWSWGGAARAEAGTSFETGVPIVEIQDLVAFETYVCATCTPTDLDGATLPPGFVRVPNRRAFANYAVAGKLPTDPDFVGIDVDGLHFERVARLHGGLAGAESVGAGTIAHLESDRTLRFDAGREIHELFDGTHRYVLFATGDASDLATLPLPAGWSRSTRVLERDLVVVDPSGFPFVFDDVQRNLWQRLTVRPEARVPEPWRLAGKRIALTDRRGAPTRRRLTVALGGGPVPSPGAAADPTVSGGWMILENPASGETDSAALPAAGWRGVGKPAGSKGWRYRDTKRERGPCQKVVVRPSGRITIVCRGADVGIGLDEPSQGSLAVGLAFGPTLTYCAEFGGRVRHDTSTAGPRGRGRFVARDAEAPAVCPFLPIYRLPTLWDRSFAPLVAMQVRGRERDAPIVSDIGAMNVYTVVDPAADAAYSAGVLPLLAASGAALLVAADTPTFVDATSGPADWAQPHLALPHYVGAQGILGMVTGEAFGPLLALKEAQVGDSLHFGLQLCLHDCEALVGGLLPIRITGRLLALHFTAPRATIEEAVPRLAAEAAGVPGLRLGWAGRTVADVQAVLETGQTVASGVPLGADGSLVYALEGGLGPADVLALPEVTALLARTGAHVAVFFGP